MATEPQADERVQIHPGSPPSASLRTADGRWVRIHSGRDPVAEAERFVEAALGGLPGGAPGLVVVIGPGLGYIVDAIERRAPETKVIAIEPFAALARAMLARRDWRARMEQKRLALLAGPDYREVTEAARLIDERAAASATIVEHPVLAREFGEEMARARGVAQRMLEGARLNAEARRAFAGRYLLNTLRNLPALLEEGDVASLRDAFAGVPAIVVAAGPSLDRNLPHLRALADRALIIAVDTTLRPLRRAGIRPHLVVAVDPSELNARHLLGLDDTGGSWLVSEGSIDPRVFPQFGGRVFSFKVSDHQPWPWLREHGFDRGTLRAWGSVLTTAFDLAIEVGADPIVFAGADLAYTGGLHYVRGTMNENRASAFASEEARVHDFAEATRRLRRATIEIDDVHGRKTTSTPQFVQFRDWLVSRAADAPARRIINATGAGILHGGAIAQADFGTLSLPPMLIDIHERLAASTRATSQAAADASRRLHAALGLADPPEIPTEAWIEFAAGTLTAAEIRECLRPGWTQAPVVTRHPASVRRIVGAPARFVAAASGAGRLQWQTSGDEGQSWADIADARTPVFLWRSGDAPRVRAVFTNARGSTVTDAAVVEPAQPAAPNDFDGDGRPDVLWRHVPTGECVVWFMDGASFREVGRIAEHQPDLAWRAVAVGDVNGDGQVDIVWRHVETGATTAWLMRGIEVIGQIELDVEPDPAWEIVGAADFDGDGLADLLWRHRSHGTVRVGERLLGTESDLDWQIVGVADFNGDGHPDLVWRHAGTGENRIWFVNATGEIDARALDAEPDGDWQIVSTNDFDGDGRPDLLWRHRQTGENRLWLMDGIARVGSRSFEPTHLATVTTDWVVVPER